MKISVPVNIAMKHLPFDEQKILRELKKLDAECIVFTVLDISDEDFVCSEIKKHAPFFKEQGYEVRVWLGGSLMHFNYEGHDFTRRVFIDGRESPNAVCPFDERFRKYYCGLLQKILHTGIDTVFFDDDFRINFWTGGTGCFCKLHMAEYRRLLGKNTTLKDVRKNILCGAPNKYRAAWQKINSSSLQLFARDLRAAADEINPAIRLGLCTSHAVWGTDAWVEDIIRILSGDNKPLLRFWGAPYNAACVADSISLEQLEYTYFAGKNAEIMAEGDTYPKPRYNVSAALSELFDLAIRAYGKLDLLKYAVDYHSSADYETGYTDKAEANKPLYKEVEEAFANKECVGINITEILGKTGEKNFERDFSKSVESLMIFPAVKMLNDLSLPAVFNRGETGVVFGENARFVDKQTLKKGTILDLTAAEILTERGIDSGLREIKGKIETGRNFVYEKYVGQNEYVWLQCNLTEFTVSEKAEISSEFIVQDKTYTGAYYYSDGEYNFFVLPFDAFDNMYSHQVFRNYCRQEQIIKAYERLSGKRLDAVCTKNPDLYIMTKKSPDGTLAVGLWNFSQDSIDVPEVRLARSFSEIRFINCKGKLEDKKAVLSAVPAFSFAAFEVKP